MAIAIGRVGYLGLGLESDPGTAVGASIFLQYTDIGLRGHHEAIEIVASKASRLMDKNSVVGKKWGEGDVSCILDVVSSGYLWKMALGSELLEMGTPNSHTFYLGTTASGNTPKTATLIQGRDTDVQQYAFAAIDELSMEVSDGLATLTASMQTDFPTNAAAQTVTTTSGTHLSFKDMSVQFGNTLTLAAAASATAVNELTLSLANNLEVIHRSGSSTVSTIKTKGFRASGSYTLYFDNITDRDAYYALQKRAMIITFTGNANEQIRIRVSRFRLSEDEISTGLDDFFVSNVEWVAEDYVDPDTATRLIDVRVQNDKATVY